MVDLSGNLGFLPSYVLKEISDVITKAKMNLLLDDAVMAVLESDSGPDVFQPGRIGN